ncbi:hypothetical protein FHS15_003960 [Paenibacillus castaneae]|uniref:STM4014 family protein n=1 Tax=Paenibacillus castaneae TaxID=474957 RepID=UPI000C9A1A03|nr:STM4014 family protein [Paenibacillus castaneae]NIK78814.1 hypothetical protein [Paenibacillus castaneae]
MRNLYEDISGAGPFILIGNPNNKRTSLLQAARNKLGLKPAVVVSYEQLLKRIIHIGNVLELYAGLGTVILRLDAPGEDEAVERELIAWGASDHEGDDAFWTASFVQDSISAEQARSLPSEHGRILYPGQWYRGYCRFLAAMQKEVKAAGIAARWMNQPDQIASMFDKRSCWQLLSRQGVSVPSLPAPVGSIQSYDSLRAAMVSSGMNRLFIKLACGSGAAGVLAYQYNPRTGAELAITTIDFELRQDESFFYNAGRMRRYQEHAVIRMIIDYICMQGAHIERWIEKESLDMKSFDVRQLVVNGEACHTVLRLSSSPITNLHLRNERRMNEGELLPEEVEQAVRNTAEAALLSFPGCSTAGIDVLVQRGSSMTYAIDINPFGDLLYGALYKGFNPYEWQMLQLPRKE